MGHKPYYLKALGSLSNQGKTNAIQGGLALKPKACTALLSTNTDDMLPWYTNFKCNPSIHVNRLAMIHKQQETSSHKQIHITTYTFKPKVIKIKILQRIKRDARYIESQDRITNH